MRTAAGIALIGLSLLMLLGFLRSDATLSSPKILAAVTMAVVVPGIAGGMLLLRRRR